MNNTWCTKKIGEIIVENKKSILKSRDNKEGSYPFFVSGYNVKNINDYLIDGENLYLPTGGDFFVHYYEGKAAYSTDTWSIKTIENVCIKYLYYFLILNSELISSRFFKGATIKHLQKRDFRNLVIHLPSIDVQEAIVGKLDEFFKNATVINDNAQNNRKNAKELFGTFLNSVFANPGKDWQEKKLHEVCDFVRGPFGGSLKKSIFKENGYAVYEQQHAIYNQFERIRYFIDERKFNEMKRFELKPGDLIMSCSGTMGKIAIAPKNLKKGIINQALLKLSPNKSLSNEFLKYWMQSGAFQDDLSIYTKGAAIRNVVSVKMLKEIKISIPKLQKQKIITEKISLFLKETERLQKIYEQELVDLEELKNSVLKLAFAGELSPAISPIQRKDLFPAQINGISITDLHAGILAMAYLMHEKSGRSHNFGHVKAEKISHMVESYLGIDLGRTPVKDAAGPSDHKHLKQVEHRAKMAGFFDFQRGRIGYRVTKRRKFDELIKKTQIALGDRITEVEQLFAEMLPWDTQTTEIFCTTYAAWNNLLMSGIVPSDAKIVYEARENWHNDKLKISEERFYRAIKWIRDNGFTPQGRGKFVGNKKRP